MRTTLHDVHREIQRTIDQLYGSICFTRGSKPDLKLLQRLFIPNGTLINNNNADEPAIMSVSEFVTLYEIQIATGAVVEFYESELAHTTEVYGAIAHRFSTYEAKFDRTNPEPFSIGINSIQLVNVHGEWLVSSMVWNDQTPQCPIPSKYLPQNA